MAYGNGSIYQRSTDGRWVASVEVAAPGERKRRRRYFTGPVREVVEAKLAAYRASNPAPAWYDRVPRADRVANAEGGHTLRDFGQLVRQRGTACEYCGIATSAPREKPRPTDRVRDHRIPLARGGSDDISNIAVCCRRCNDSKGIKTVEEFLVWSGRGL